MRTQDVLEVRCGVKQRVVGSTGLLRLSIAELQENMEGIEMTGVQLWR